MRVANFSLIIPEGRERGEGHVAMRHDTRYTIKIANHGHKRCDALVTVDGKDMGGFRLDAGCALVLERPAHDTGCFTFYKSGTEEFQVATGGKVSKDERGLIRVTFKPEKPFRPVAKQISREDCVLTSGIDEEPQGDNAHEYIGRSKPLRRSTDDLKSHSLFGSLGSRERIASGATGLAGKSSQDFTVVSALDYAPEEEVTISLRLVCAEPAVRELTSAPRSNPVPAPVD